MGFKKQNPHDISIRNDVLKISPTIFFEVRPTISQNCESCQLLCHNKLKVSPLQLLATHIINKVLKVSPIVFFE